MIATQCAPAVKKKLTTIVTAVMTVKGTTLAVLLTMIEIIVTATKEIVMTAVMIEIDVMTAMMIEVMTVDTTIVVMTIVATMTGATMIETEEDKIENTLYCI